MHRDCPIPHRLVPHRLSSVAQIKAVKLARLKPSAIFHNDYAPKSGTPRKRKHPDDMSNTEYNKRKKKLRTAKAAIEAEAAITFEQAFALNKVPIKHAINLPQNIRKKVRKTLPTVKLPADTTINKLREELSKSHGTQTATFKDAASGLAGTYACDPVKLIGTATSCNPQCEISADKGGKFLKVGLIYHDLKNNTQCLPLLCAQGDETIDTLNVLKRQDLLKFTGESSKFLSLFDLLLSLVHEKRALFVADYKFTSLLTGIKQPGKTEHPCPMCMIDKDHYFDHAEPRAPGDQRSRKRKAVLAIPVDQLVPLPLHVKIGIVNKMIKVKRRK